MELTLLNETPISSALLGLSLSYYREGESIKDWWTEDKERRAFNRLKALAFKGGGHSKALSAITVDFLVTAPRCWYSEFDTYNFKVRNSASTMHTLSKSKVTRKHFHKGTSPKAINNLNDCIDDFNNPDSEYYKDITRLKMNLPEGYLQTSQVTTNYLSLQTMVNQRRGHRLSEWDMFINMILTQVSYPCLIDKSIEDS